MTLVLRPWPTTQFSPAVLAAVGFTALGRRFLTWRLVPGTKKPVKMPCDGRWPETDIAKFEKWKNGGMPA